MRILDQFFRKAGSLETVIGFSSLSCVKQAGQTAQERRGRELKKDGFGEQGYEQH
jgi:hypothetical protein